MPKLHRHQHDGDQKQDRQIGDRRQRSQRLAGRQRRGDRQRGIEKRQRRRRHVGAAAQRCRHRLGLPRHQVDGDVLRAARQFMRQGAAEQFAERPAVRATDDDLGDVLEFGKAQHLRQARHCR